MEQSGVTVEKIKSGCEWVLFYTVGVPAKPNANT